MGKLWVRERLLLPSPSRGGVRWWFFPGRHRRLTRREFLFVFILLSTLSFFVIPEYFNFRKSIGRLHNPPVPSFQCPVRLRDTLNTEFVDPHDFSKHNHSLLKLDPKVLVFVETQFSLLGRQIVELMEAARFKMKIEISGKSLPLLTNLDKGKFSVIIFENLDKYIYMNKWNRELLDKYCREYQVGVIAFAPHAKEPTAPVFIKGLPLILRTRIQLHNYYVDPASPVLRIARGGPVHPGPLPGFYWSAFESLNSTFQPIAEADHIVNKSISISKTANSKNNESFVIFKEKMSTIVYDNGTVDGIERIFFGSGFDIWIHKVLLLDSISFLSRRKLSLSLKRFLLVDIDDIFVGETGTRIRPPDVQVLLSTQRKFRQLIPGFTFNLGFSGKYYHRGTDEEDAGDDYLIQHADRFWWFCHMRSHSQPHCIISLF